MFERLTNDFPMTEDAARKIMISNGFIPAGKRGHYKNAFEGISVNSRLNYTGLIDISFILKFDNDVYFVKFIREFLAYFSNRYNIAHNGFYRDSTYYVFYNEKCYRLYSYAFSA